MEFVEPFKHVHVEVSQAKMMISLVEVIVTQIRLSVALFYRIRNVVIDPYFQVNSVSNELNYKNEVREAPWKVLYAFFLTFLFKLYRLHKDFHRDTLAELEKIYVEFFGASSD